MELAALLNTPPPLGCDQVNCLAGVATPGVPEEILRETFVSNLQFAAAELEKAGITLLIEAINTRDIPGFFLQTTSQALAIVADVGSENLKLQYDIYHMQIMEGRPDTDNRGESPHDPSHAACG